MALKVDGLAIPLDDVTGLGREGYTFFQNSERVELPKVHYIFYKEKGEEGVSVLCIELGLFTWGKEQKEAQKNISVLCKNHIKNVLFGEYNKTVGGDMLESLLHKLKSVKADNYWEIYRLINFRTALRGNVVVDNIDQAIIIEQSLEIEKLKDENRRLREALGKSSSNVDLEKFDKKKETIKIPDNHIFTSDYTHLKSA